MIFNPVTQLYTTLRNLFGGKKADKLSAVDIKILENYFPYFRGLSNSHKIEFKARLGRFIAEKTFVPRGGLKEITSEMRILIGATAVMVMFGFQNVTLRHFKKILVYPDDYYSTINRNYHQGEVNPKLGIIVISWRSFVTGFAEPGNGVNLGIHEMAHALKLENQIHYNRESNFFNPSRWRSYHGLALLEIETIRRGGYSPLRASAANNSHEFFAVVLEAFFEKPKKLKSHNPKLYESLVFLLKQNPLALMK